MELEQQRLARKEQQLYLKGKNGSMTAEAVSSRAREIARAALNLSDLELDDFFSEANAVSFAVLSVVPILAIFT